MRRPVFHGNVSSCFEQPPLPPRIYGNETAHLNEWAVLCHRAAASNGWWHTRYHLESEEGPSEVVYSPNRLNLGERIILIVSELIEGFEGARSDSRMDDHLPHRPSLEVELADTLIRIFDLAGALRLDLDGAVREKLIYNANRADHKIENREQEGGKKW